MNEAFALTSSRETFIAILKGLMLAMGAIDTAIPQDCATMQTDNAGQVARQVAGSDLNWVWTGTGAFNLDQNSNGYIGGSLANQGNVCPAGVYYNTTGSINTFGQFSLTSTYAGPGTGTAGCANTLSMSGTLGGAGCATASGNWSNSASQSGTFTMTHGCYAPTGETNQVFQNWTPQTKNGFLYVSAIFNVQAAPTPPTFSWGGRTVSETFPQPAADGCYFPGSAQPKIVSIATASVTLGTSGTYQDSIGPLVSAVTYYRQQGRTPCSITTQQVLVIDCPNPPANPTYATVTQIDTIGPLQVTITRGNNPPVSEIFAPPAPALTLPAILFNLLFLNH